jgi:tetratricopeptide (TPR) repeat protein
MERLLVDFPLNPTLFRALRGNVLWARGDYEQAASEYRLALTQPSDEQALLANNLGAILLDAGSDAASAELGQAVQLLGGQDRGELRFNLALLAHREGRIEDAMTELEQARNLLEPNVPLLAALTEAYRNTGRLADAQQTLEAATRQTGRDDDLAPSTFRPLFQQYLSSIVQEQRGLLELAQAVDAYGPLTWQLEIASLQPRAEFAASVDALRDATGKGDDLIRGWRRISAGATDEANITGLVAIGQAQQAEQVLNRQRYHLALALIESGRTDLNRAPGLLSAINDALFGSGTHITEAQTLLTTLTILEPMDTAVLIADARLARLRNNYAKADQLYDRIISLAPQQPEGYYGNGLVDRNNGDRGAARQRMFEAIERNSNFYPARYTLIQIAEEEGDWPTVLEQARILVEQRPGFERELNLAVALRRSGPSGFDEAEQILVRLSETDQAPVERNRAQALIELGYLHRDADRPAEALRAFEDARRADPNSALAAYELGQMLLAQEDYTAAAEQLQNVVNNDNQHVAAHVALADLYRERLEQPNTAITHYRRALDTRTANADQLMRIGEGLFVLNQTEPAADALRRAAEQEPNNPQLLHSLAQANLRLGRLDAAAQAEQRVLELTAERATDEQRRLSAAALVGLGDVERLRQNGISPQRQNFGPAIDYYNQALALDPNQVDAIIGLGLVAVAQNNWAVALGHFERANQLPNANEDPQARFWLAEALLRRPDPQRASEIYAQSLEITQQVDFPEAWFGLAQAQYATGDISTASQSLDIALEQRPNYAEALLFRGKLLEEQGRVDEALDAYSASINANNRIAETYYRRGQLYTQQLNYDRAASDFRRATELQPNFAEAFYWLGRSYFAQERMTQALDSFQQAIASRGGIYPEARLHQGLAEEAMQQFSAAAESFRSVIQNDQLSEWADQARLELEQVQEIINNQ